MIGNNARILEASKEELICRKETTQGSLHAQSRFWHLLFSKLGIEETRSKEIWDGILGPLSMQLKDIDILELDCFFLRVPWTASPGDLWPSSLVPGDPYKKMNRRWERDFQDCRRGVMHRETMNNREGDVESVNELRMRCAFWEEKAIDELSRVRQARLYHTRLRKSLCDLGFFCYCTVNSKKSRSTGEHARQMKPWYRQPCQKHHGRSILIIHFSSSRLSPPSAIQKLGMLLDHRPNANISLSLRIPYFYQFAPSWLTKSCPPSAVTECQTYSLLPTRANPTES